MIFIKILNYIKRKLRNSQLKKDGTQIYGFVDLESKIGRNSIILGDVFVSFCEGNNSIKNGSSVENSYLGYGTYISYKADIKNATIGSYSSIGPRVAIITGQHPVDMISTCPSFYATNPPNGLSFYKDISFQEQKYIDERKKYVVDIGSDVWIGADVKIMEGIHIGDGAVIGAGALVTKDVPPYSIYGGVPAKLLRMRFDDEVIEKLIKIKWWTRSPEWIHKHANLFNDPTQFIEYEFFDC